MLTLALLSTAGSATAASADARSADIELLRLRAGPDALFVESTAIAPRGQVGLAALFAYEHQPVVLFHESDFEGAPVGERFASAVGIDAGLLPWLAVGAVVPAFVDFGSDPSPYANDGFFLGDLAFVLRTAIVRSPAAGLLLRGEIITPTGPRGSWTGEGAVRGVAAAVASLRVGRLDASLDLGAHFRPDVETDAGWNRQDEALGGLQVRWAILPHRFALAYGLLSRSPLSLDGSSQDRTLEALAGVQAAAGDLQFSLGAGLGLDLGVGQPDYRLFTGVVWRRVPPPPEAEAAEPDLTMVVDRLQEPPPDAPVAVAIEGWQQGELVREAEDQIEIRDPIQFEFAREVILPESRPVLDAVARLLMLRGDLGHVVIQGHASEEGSFIYNYDLSGRRARGVGGAGGARGAPESHQLPGHGRGGTRATRHRRGRSGGEPTGGVPHRPSVRARRGGARVA